MFLRIMLFLATNVLIVLVISVILSVLGVGNYITASGLDYGQLLIFCFIWGMVGSLISLALSRVIAKLAMRVKVIPAEDPGQFAWLVQTVHALARSAHLPAMPEVGVFDSADPNAFATGPTKRRSLVAVSTGLLQNMNKDQIEGVLAHEVAHVANGDMVTMTLIQGVVNAMVMFFARIISFAVAQSVKENMRWLVNFVVTIVLQLSLGILGMMVVGWFSRKREFRADAGSARLAGREKMISALQALQRLHGLAHPEATPASMAALQISGKTPSNPLFSIATHPPLDSRIEALQKMSMS